MIADVYAKCQRQQRTVFERVRDVLSTRLRHAFDLLSTCLRPVHARHASLRPGFRPGFRPARLMEFGLNTPVAIGLMNLSGVLSLSAAELLIASKRSWCPFVVLGE